MSEPDLNPNDSDTGIVIAPQAPTDMSDFMLVSTPTAVLAINPPRSWLARRLWLWLGFEWRTP